MIELISKFQSEISLFSNDLDKFPADKRPVKLFDEWRLNDLVAHLSGWYNYQLQTLSAFSSHHPMSGQVDVQTKNEESVKERQKKAWEEIYTEWKTSAAQLITAYTQIPETDLSLSVFSDRQKTPAELLQIEIKHLEKTHRPQVEKVLNNL